MKSQFLTVGARDFLRGLLVAILSAIADTILEFLLAGGMPNREQWARVGIVALSAGVGYIKLNLLTNSKGGIGPEKKE